MPEPKRWAETEEGREMLKHIREMIESMKADGLEVRDLEEFLKSPHPTREGVEFHHEVFLKRSGGNEGNFKVFASQKSPQVISEEKYYRFESRSTGKAPGEAAGPEKAVLHGCPRCGKTVKPGWKSCPFCRSKLPPSEPQSKSPEPGRWADTEDAKRIIGDIRRSLARWKAAGHDVHELEYYLDSDDPNPTQLFVRLRVLLKKIDEPWPGEVERLAPLQCPKCARPVESKHGRCPFCGALLSLDNPPGPNPRQKAEPSAGRCPECHGRVGPKDRKCPVCGHRLKPWFSF